MARFTTYFTTRPYVCSHGKQPRGRGSWAFSFNNGEPVFAPTMTYGEAKRWAKQQAQLVGSNEVEIAVLP